MDYAKVKQWLSEHNREIVVGVCFILVFLVGFGVGRYERETRRSAALQQINYSTKQQPEATKETEDKPPAAPTAGAEVSTPAPVGAVTAECPIKGNIASGGRKIYHLKGGSFYDRTNPEQCFNTEAEARAAGFTKSSR